MKVLHTADWHLGKKLGRYSRLEEQKEVLEEICNIADANEVDVVVIAGDIYDTINPPTEAVDLFFRTAHRLAKNGARAVFAIAGNHDSPTFIDAPISLANECGIFLMGTQSFVNKSKTLQSGLSIEVTEEGFMRVSNPNWDMKINCIMTPYADEKRLKLSLGGETGEENREANLETYLKEKWEDLAQSFFDANDFNLLMTHLFVVPSSGEIIEEEDDQEKSVNYVGGAQTIRTTCFPTNADYVALGHLHRQHQVGDSKVYYSGSPLQYSFSEKNHKKSVSIIEKSDKLKENETTIGQIDMKIIPLSKGFKVREANFSTLEELLDWLKRYTDDYVSVGLEVEEYITAEQQRIIVQNHSKILGLIPIIKSFEEVESQGKQETITTYKTMEDAFEAYFGKAKNAKPTKELMDLFKEIVNTDI